MTEPVAAPSGPPLALFDFDGTLTTADTMFAFVRHVVGGPRFALGMLWLAPGLLAHKLGLVPAHKAKTTLLRHFLGGRPAAELEAAAARWSATALPALLRPDGLRRLAALRAEGAELLLVSASLDLWLRPFAEAQGMRLLCTVAEIDAEGRFTGGIASLNCNGDEKAARVRASTALTGRARIEAYGDTAGDAAMLGLADRAYYKPFRS